MSFCITTSVTNCAIAAETDEIMTVALTMAGMYFSHRCCHGLKVASDLQVLAVHAEALKRRLETQQALGRRCLPYNVKIIMRQGWLKLHGLVRGCVQYICLAATSAVLHLKHPANFVSEHVLATNISLKHR